MVFEFTTTTVYDTVGEIIHHSRQHRNLIQPKYIKSHIRYRLYDINGNIIGEYSSSVKGWKKSIARDMYRSKRGSIESICSHNTY